MQKTIAYDRQIFTKQNKGGISRYFNLLVGNIDQCSNIASARFQKPFWGALDPLFDVVHATYYLGAPYSLSSGQLLVSTLHDMIPEKHPEYFFLGSLRSPHANKRAWLNKSDLIISVSSSSADDLAFFSPENASRIVVIHHASGMGMVEPSPIADLTNRQFYLFVGKRQGYKNGILLLRLLALLKSSGQLPIQFPVIVFAGGEKLTNTEKRLIAENSLVPFLYFCTPTDPELAWLYRKSQAVLVPSIAEGFSFPVVEAFVCNAPVIVSDIEVHREVGGGFATILSPHNLLAWRDCILDHAYRSPKLTMDFSSYQALLNHYSLQRFIIDHSSAYAR